MSNIEYGYSYKLDEVTGAHVSVRIEVQVPDRVEVRLGELDEIADDAVESVLVTALVSEDEY